jgi:hypothetical protein
MTHDPEKTIPDGVKPCLVLDVKPDWHENFDNRPGFQVLLSALPDVNDHIYVTDGKGHYRSQVDDYVTYMFSDGKPTHGYGGRQFRLKMEDGTIREFKGGWSSNADAINKSFPDLDSILEASVTNDVEVMKRGYTFSGAVTVRSILEWWLDNQRVDWGLALLYDDYSVWIEPTKGRFIKWGDQINVALRFTPQPAYSDADYRARVRELFWKKWSALQSACETLNSELSGEQNFVVRA